MIIELSEIRSEGLDLEGTLPADILDSHPDDPARCVSPIDCRLHCQLAGDDLIVEGTLTAKLELRCRRCDCAYGKALEGIAYHYDERLDPMAESVDLTDDIREAMILALPSYPVCRETCRGLCPQCGVNLNESDCDCGPPEDKRWAALDNFGKE